LAPAFAAFAGFAAAAVPFAESILALMALVLFIDTTYLQLCSSLALEMLAGYLQGMGKAL